MNARNGQLIRSYRRTNELTQGALAALVGVSTAAVSQWERGETTPEPANVHRLEEILKAGGVLAQAFGLVNPKENDLRVVVAELTRQIAELRDEIAVRDRALDALAARVAQLEAG